MVRQKQQWTVGAACLLFCAVLAFHGDFAVSVCVGVRKAPGPGKDAGNAGAQARSAPSGSLGMSV